MEKGEKLILITQIQRKVQKNRTLEGIASELEEEPSAIADIYQRLCEAGN